MGTRSGGGKRDNGGAVANGWHVLDAGSRPGANRCRAVHVWHDFPLEGVGATGLARTAAAQRGVVSLAQLKALGFDYRAIDRAVERGTLHRVLPRAFAVGHPALAPLAAETAALLYAGNECVLSHGSAGALWGLCARQAQVSLTVVGRHVRRQPDLVLHRTQSLDSRDVQLRSGLPVTTAGRTLIDLAGVVSPEALERALNEARVLRLVTDASLVAGLERNSSRHGVAKLRALLKAQEGPRFTRSEAERLLAQMLERAQLSPTRLNCVVEGCEVDALWAAERIVIEVDGFAAHGHRAAFENDRRRDQRLAAAGYTVIRVTWRQLVDEQLAVVARVAQALALARAALAERAAEHHPVG